jgi:putative polyketide hydroxylase
MPQLDAKPLTTEHVIERVPVLVVGGGLVGLATALFLARQGVRPLLLEKHEGTSIHPRARGIHAPTVELLAAAGVGEAMARAARTFARDRPLGALTATTLSGPVQSYVPWEMPREDQEPSPCPTVALGQDRLEPMILEAMRALGVEARFGHKVLEVVEEEGVVTADVLALATDDRYRVSADYLVAADGTRSPIREALAIGRTGRGMLANAISTIFEADLSPFQEGHPFFIAQITHPEVRGVIVGSDLPNRWIFGTNFDPSRESPADFTEARFTKLVRMAAGAPDLDVTIRGAFPWEVAERVAERFRAGRIFLAGDAAHQMPPAGAHGANTGIHDAANLAWKLAAVLSGQAGAGLLDTYDEERRPVAVATANQAALKVTQQRQLRGAPGKPGDAPAGAILPDAIVNFGYRYGAADPLPYPLRFTGEPGTRAPHLWLALAAPSSPSLPSLPSSHAGFATPTRAGRTSTRDFLHDGFTLLTADASWARAADEAAGAGLPVRAVLTEGFQEAFGVGAGGASLLRPDGFVAARWSDAVSASNGALTMALTSALHR